MQQSLTHFTIAATGYFLLACFGLLLAIPPGFASAVWPASGVALGCALLLKSRSTYLGIWLGSFLVNLLVASDYFSQLTSSTWQLPFLIALGAPLQAALGAYLYKKLIGEPSPVDSPSHIIKLIAVIAPVSCLLASIIGNISLYSLNIIQVNNLAFSWFTWWVGDSLGICLVTPLLLALFASKRRLTNARKLQAVIPTSIILLGVLISFFASLESRHHQIQSKIEDYAQNYFHLVRENMKISISKLTSFSGLYLASEHVSQKEFEIFSHAILESKSDLFLGFGWTEILSHPQRLEYERKMQTAGYPNFQLTEISNQGKQTVASKKERYYPVISIYPAQKNRAAIGLDLSSNAKRFKALKEATISKQPVATAPLNLVQTDKGQHSIIVYLPIYKKQNSLSEKLFGFVSSVINVEAALKEVLTESKRNNIAFNITDITDDIVQTLITNNTEPKAGFNSVKFNEPFAGRSLEIEFFADENFLNQSKDWLSYIILTFGLMVAALLQAFILLITGQTANIQRQVEEKTKRLLAAKIAAEEANKAKSIFTANISHEIRTPLNAIIGFIRQCLKTPLNEKQAGYLKNSEMACETLMALINNTLDFSRIESGKLIIERKPFDLAHLLRKTYAIFNSQAEAKEVDFGFFVGPGVPVMLVGDPLRVEQILLNLCGNAFKFTQQGHVNLSITANKKLSDGVEILFSIEDSGIGISESQQASLFKAFEQADSSTSRKYGGSGLGLAISKRLVELMAGEISIESKENIGSRFCFSIPFEFTDAQDMIKVEDITMPLYSEAISASQTKKPLNGRTILVVEDVEMNQILIEEILLEYGAKVELAANGKEALAKINPESHYDLILMDIQMPEMDGYEASKNIRLLENYQTTPIIALTANAMKEDISKCLKAGMNDHIPKPIDEAETIRTILQHLNKPKIVLYD